jgi:hypothetical protein
VIFFRDTPREICAIHAFGHYTMVRPYREMVKGRMAGQFRFGSPRERRVPGRRGHNGTEALYNSSIQLYIQLADLRAESPCSQLSRTPIGEEETKSTDKEKLRTRHSDPSADTERVEPISWDGSL